MTTLAVDTPRRYVPFGTDVDDQPVIAADIIYEGAAVGDNGSGYARPLVAGDPFRGFAIEKADNAAGSAGDKHVHLKVRGHIQLAVGSAAITDVGKPVYASDDNTFTLTQSTNSFVGRITRFVSTGVVIVAFDAGGPPGADLGNLTVSSGDTTPDTTIADVSTVVTGVDGTGSNAASKADVDARLVAIDSNFADVGKRLNDIVRQLAAR